MQHFIDSCLWFDNEAEDVVKFYASVFKNSKIGRTTRYGESYSTPSNKKPGSVLTAECTIEGYNIMALNGGPMFKFTPSLSLFVWCDSEQEIDELWKKLSSGGEVRMGLDKYPWAEKYGWTKDKFGVEWQMMIDKRDQKITPAFLFVNKLFGKGEEAIKFYTSVFPNSKIETIFPDEKTKTVMHGKFSLNGDDFILMEGQGEHKDHVFTNAFSLMVNCETQSEIDTYWEKLSAGGSIEQCGWLKDKYGVSWQIVPRIMGDLVADPKKGEKVMAAVMKMVKLDIAKIKAAAQ